LETSVATTTRLKEREENRLNTQIKALEAEAKLGKTEKERYESLETILKDPYQRKERELLQELDKERKKIPKEL